VGARSRPQSSSLCSRLSADNVKQAGRHLGKLCHGYAPAVFAVALEQLQAYANLVAPVVAAFKYLTPLGVDVLMCMSA
jgi:THO complex subunit 2